jgi:deazaflavin-dependent oxidoreductase (nitroreductase family)
MACVEAVGCTFVRLSCRMVLVLERTQLRFSCFSERFTSEEEEESMYGYKEASPLQRIVRRTAGTRPMAWLYIRIQQRIDRYVYGFTGGRTTASSWLSGLPVIMLTTIGAKTGQRRTVPLLGLLDGEQLVVIASNFGQRHHPSWYYNLQAHPRASVTIEGVTHEVEAHELTGEEREQYFQRAIEMYPPFVHYRQWADDRGIPVIKLDPAS